MGVILETKYDCLGRVNPNRGDGKWACAQTHCKRHEPHCPVHERHCTANAHNHNHIQPTSLPKHTHIVCTLTLPMQAQTNTTSQNAHTQNQILNALHATAADTCVLLRPPQHSHLGAHLHPHSRPTPHPPKQADSHQTRTNAPCHKLDKANPSATTTKNYKTNKGRSTMRS